MGTSMMREKRRVQILMALSIAFAASFLASFISQTVELARLEAWRVQLEQDLRSLERQRAELQSEIALRDTDAWLTQAAIEAGFLPPNAYAIVTVTPQEASPAAAAVEPQGSVGDVVAAPSAPDTVTARSLWDNPNWRAWRRLLTGRP